MNKKVERKKIYTTAVSNPIVYGWVLVHWKDIIFKRQMENGETRKEEKAGIRENE